MSKSKIFLYFLLSFIGGVFVSSFLEIPEFIIYEFFALGIFYSILFFKQKAILVFAICLIIFGLGVFRTEISKLTEERTLKISYLYQAEEKEDSLIHQKLSGFKQRLRDVIYQNLSPPQSSILAAIILGDKGRIPKEWKQKLNVAGVRHITAISGMHIVILSQILIWLAIFLRLYRGQAFYFATILLWLFILMVGFQPSAIRAGIMGSAFLFCQKIGREKAALNALVLAATIMLVINPLLLKESIGFQLSFLATLGIIYFSPYFSGLLGKAQLLKAPDLSGLLAMTFGALIFTLPILIYNFGYLSLVTPITNILIVPLLPYIMGMGLFFVLLGAIWQPIAWILSLPVWLLTTYLTKIVDFFSQISWASQTFHLSWLWLPLIYFGLGYLVYRIAKKPKLKFLG